MGKRRFSLVDGGTTGGEGGGDGDEPKVPAYDLYEFGARVRAVGGPFGSVTVVEIPTGVAERWFPNGIGASGGCETVDGAAQDIEALAKALPSIEGGALAAALIALARDIDSPLTSPTARSMCASQLKDALRELRDLAPPEEKKGALHDIRTGRSDRLAGGGPAA